MHCPFCPECYCRGVPTSIVIGVQHGMLHNYVKERRPLVGQCNGATRWTWHPYLWALENQVQWNTSFTIWNQKMACSTFERIHPLYLYFRTCKFHVFSRLIGWFKYLQSKILRRLRSGDQRGSTWRNIPADEMFCAKMSFQNRINTPCLCF